MKKVAISACLTGRKCRYDASDNKNENLLELLSGMELIPFCPEDHAFGSPRPTMDLIENEEGTKAISNKNGADLSFAIEGYAKKFFLENPDIDLFVGKDRSPSCGVCSAKVYDKEKNLLSTKGTGLMAKEALALGIESYDAERY